MADSRIKSVSELLSAFFDQDMAKKGEDYVGFSRSWKSIAGSRLGEHSHPADLRHGLLIVEAEHQGWMQLLQLQQDKMLEEIQRKFPDLGIRGMAFRLGKPAAPPRAVGVAGGLGKARPAEPVIPKAPERGAEGRSGAGEAGPEVDGAIPKPGDAVQKKRSLPPDLAAMFAKIRKNIEK